MTPRTTLNCCEFAKVNDTDETTKAKMSVTPSKEREMSSIILI